MHFIRSLINFMFPIVPVVLESGSNDIPIGESFVITNTGSFVVTSSGNNVIIKS